MKMKKSFAAALACMFIMSLAPAGVSASVSADFAGGDSEGYYLTYPVADIDSGRAEKLINEDILAQVKDLESQVKDKVYSKADMTYYEKYEDDNIISLMFYVNTTKRFTNRNILRGYTVTYDKHDGSRVPMSRYLTITLPQLQDALNHSRAYAVDGLDNEVNLDRPIPYVSDNYFICHDGSIGLLYQPGDLMDESAGAAKIVVSPETIREVNSTNITNTLHQEAASAE